MWYVDMTEDNDRFSLNFFSFFSLQMIQAIQVLRFHLLELEKVMFRCSSKSSFIRYVIMIICSFCRHLSRKKIHLNQHIASNKLMRFSTKRKKRNLSIESEQIIGLVDRFIRQIRYRQTHLYREKSERERQGRRERSMDILNRLIEEKNFLSSFS